MSSERLVSDVDVGLLPPIQTLSFVVDEDAVLAVGPVEPGAGSAPCAQKLPVGIELEQRWCGLRALRVGHGARSMQDPDVIVAVDGHAWRLSKHPVVGQLGRPRRIHFEDRESLRGRGRLRLRADVREQRDRRRHRDEGSNDTDDTITSHSCRPNGCSTRRCRA
jgi:hypothetical protein